MYPTGFTYCKEIPNVMLVVALYTHPSCTVHTGVGASPGKSIVQSREGSNQLNQSIQSIQSNQSNQSNNHRQREEINIKKKTLVNKIYVKNNIQTSIVVHLTGGGFAERGVVIQRAAAFDVVQR